ncbi:FAD-binding oxidoreductase [Paracoccus pantotrophus]|uniref:NAD(P)/FAD-dependent oxidoreductase n=1 Tax=Paracoccus pantotrophus TaxID=82367 RepID=UPI000E08FBB1|nr:FAD-dependent oxidoreductase [Paracoccus pantotrophus]RDD94637.1 FAD-binding oxidoreductase [Paracoccus pantotrophus]WGR66704.1 FAD-binding oxidoreductase [Paracoccus pantotrophus]
METAEIIIVGGGVVGSAIAFGLLRRGHDVLLIDGNNNDFRASKANFGLVWVQSKGAGFPEYQAVSRASALAWADFAQDVRERSGLPLDYEQKGGLVFCLGEAEWEKRSALNDRIARESGHSNRHAEMVERPALERLLPGVALGPEVVGASFGHDEGHSNPLHLLADLHAAVGRMGGRLRFADPVRGIAPLAQGFAVETGAARFECQRVVVAAGHGTASLALPLGLHIPVHEQRGQILVTERMAPFLPLPASGLRQTREGTVMIGATQEDVGFNTDTTAEATAKLATRATRIIPALADKVIVRQWAGLRVLSPDEAPVYAQSDRHPGAFAVICHSGVTLAAFHANELAEAVSTGIMAPVLQPFGTERFHVQARS